MPENDFKTGCVVLNENKHENDFKMSSGTLFYKVLSISYKKGLVLENDFKPDGGFWAKIKWLKIEVNLKET